MSRVQRKNKRYNENDSLLEGGEGEVEKPPSEKPPSEKKSEKPPSEKPKSEAVNDDDDPYAEPVLEECCCCDCVCANEFTQGYTFCICFPIKCGANFAGVLTLILTVVLFVWYYFQFMNEYLHWWYALVTLILLIPLLISASFVVSWFTKDSKTTRTMFFTSQILALVAVLLVALWNIIYFVAIYKKDLYYSGMGEISKNVYTTQSKKVFLFIMIAESVVLAIFFCYSIWVASTYRELMHGNGAFNDTEDDEADKEK